jgi:hypothetical protein
MSTPTVEIRDLAGAVVLASVPYDTLQHSDTLVGPGALDMTLSMWKPEAAESNFESGKREIRVIEDSTTVWGGYIWESSVNTDNEEVRISAEGWLSMLDHRLIDEDKIYADPEVEQFDIAWGLIHFTQSKTNGDLGITRDPGETPSGITREMKYRYWERRKVGEALAELAAMNQGFDPEITPGKVWKVYYPRKGSLLNVTFELDVNSAGVEHVRNARELATEIHAIGGGEGKATCIAVASDPTQSALYKIRQTPVDFAGIKKYDHLMKKAERYLNLHKEVTKRPQLSLVTATPPVGSYSVGDRVTVKAVLGSYVTLNEVFRIIAIEKHMDQSGLRITTVQFDDRLAP